MNEKRFLTAEEAAAFLGISSREAVYQAVRRGELPAYRIGKRRLRFKREELEAIAESGRLLTIDDLRATI